MGATKSQLYPPAQRLMADYATALAHPARLAIIDHLLKQDACICTELSAEIGLSQPTVSQHLKVLRSTGIIRGSISGASMCYCIDPNAWADIGMAFEKLFSRNPLEKGSC